MVHVKLDEGDWNGLLLLAVLSRHLSDGLLIIYGKCISENFFKFSETFCGSMHLVHSLRDVLQDQVQVDLILIKKYVIAFADQEYASLAEEIKNRCVYLRAIKS